MPTHKAGAKYHPQIPQAPCPVKAPSYGRCCPTGTGASWVIPSPCVFITYYPLPTVLEILVTT